MQIASFPRKDESSAHDPTATPNMTELDIRDSFHVHLAQIVSRGLLWVRSRCDVLGND
jgi:hypothetical protein